MKATKVGDIVRQLAAADKFLGNVRSLPSFQKIQQQQVDKSGHDEEWQVQRGAECQSV